MASQRDVQRSFRLPADLDARLVAKAEQVDRSASWVIVASLELALLGEDKALTNATLRGFKRIGRQAQNK